MERWAYDEDRIYHGTDRHEGQILVELPADGPTERLKVVVLKELQPDFNGADFGWGYNGGGTSATADAILHDATGEKPSPALREDFCADVLMHLTDEFRLRRGAVLRWVRGWAVDREVEDLPAAVATLPPISRHNYDRMPRDVRRQYHEQQTNDPH